jgi:signal transduction histidine kinase
MARAIAVGLACMLVFGIFERWPKRLPSRLPRSILQLIGIVVIVPFSAAIASAFIHDDAKLTERSQAIAYVTLAFTGVLFAPWIAVGAMLKQRNQFAREQALGFELERSELQRNALDAKLRLLQAQIEPHFLFNTLANVQALVEAGSPQAANLLNSLIAYLRAAVPRIHRPASTVGEEIELVRAYLNLMQMRMPDRLRFAVRVDPNASAVECPSMTVLTLVENAIRHGIDPSEEGGTIDVDVSIQEPRCTIRVSDTGVGFKSSGVGLGTGLSVLRERLQLAFAGEAELRITELEPHGVSAILRFPVRRDAA